MTGDGLSIVSKAYTEWFGPPVELRRVPVPGVPHQLGIVVRPPTEEERTDPIADLTLLGTAGFAAAGICEGLRDELGLEIAGTLDETATDQNVEALAKIASAPLETGRLFRANQILTNLELPAFPRFGAAILVDWDPIDTFRFPEPFEDTGLLRVLPLHLDEVEFIEASDDRTDAYLALFNRGMREADPGRESVL
jgi:hypothetical protein